MARNTKPQVTKVEIDDWHRDIQTSLMIEGGKLSVAKRLRSAFEAEGFQLQNKIVLCGRSSRMAKKSHRIWTYSYCIFHKNAHLL